MRLTVVPVLALTAVMSACKSAPQPAPGTRARCECHYLTDFDDTATVAVDVCAANDKPLLEEAAACAMHSAHNHIDTCTCRPPGAACDARAADACVDR